MPIVVSSLRKVAGRHGPAPLGGEHVDALGHLLALQAPEGADLVAAYEVHARAGRSCGG